MASKEKTIGIVGLGLIGGSVALKLRAENYVEKIIGFDDNAKHQEMAEALGLIDEQVTLDELCKNSDLILIAIPVNHALVVLPKILNSVPESTAVVDFGSTKSKIAQLADSFKNRDQFVASHPIAGTENTGPIAAFPDLYKGKVNIICDPEKSSKEVLDRVEAMITALGMRIKYMDSNAHDRHIAYVSHMSHISSFILGQTVLEVEKDEDNIFDMAGSGFASTVRLAKSSPEMWAPIFTENAENVLRVLDHYIKNLNQFRSLIVDEKEEKLKEIMSETNKIRKVLEGEKAD